MMLTTPRKNLVNGNFFALLVSVAALRHGRQVRAVPAGQRRERTVAPQLRAAVIRRKQPRAQRKENRCRNDDPPEEVRTATALFLSRLSPQKLPWMLPPGPMERSRWNRCLVVQK